MALNWQHNNTLFNLPNTSDRLLLLQAKETVNVKLIEDEMLAKCNVNVKHMGHMGAHGPPTFTWPNLISEGFQKPLANQG